MALNSKTKPYPGVPMVGIGSIETHDTTELLRAAQRKLDMACHDLRSEFITREKLLRQQFLDEVAEITAPE